MIERPTYLFFLFNDLGAPLYVDAAGNIQEGNPTTYLKPDGQLANLEQSPEGWEGILVKYGRNIYYRSLFRDMTVPMYYHGDGARICKFYKTKYGIESVLHFGIMKLDRSTLPYNYDDWHLTELNFAKYKQERDGITLEALEGGLNKLIKANENTKYKIPLDKDNAHYVVRDGLALTEAANFEVITEFEMPFTQYGNKFWVPLTFVNKEGQSSGMAWFTEQPLPNTDVPAFPLYNTNYFARAGNNLGPVDVILKGTLIYEPIADDLSQSMRMRFLRSGQDFGDQDIYALPISAFNPGETITVDVNMTIPLEPNEKLWLEGIYFGLGGTFEHMNFKFLKGSFLKATFTNRAATTYSKEMYGIDLLKGLIKEMSAGKYTADSVWLTSRKDISFTSGPGIRSKGRQNQDVIETSLKDLFQALQHWSVGLTVRANKVIIEPIADFFKNEIVLDLGVVGDYNIVMAEDLFFNEIRAGYRKIDYDNVNGLIEFNQGQNWIAPITKIINLFDLESSYRADPIGTELYRIETNDLDTTDKSSDKNVFVSNIETISQTVIQTVDFVSAGNYMTNPGGYPFAPGNIVKINGGLNNGTMLQVVATGVNIVQFTGTVVVDDLAVAATIEYVTGGLFKFNRPAYTSMAGIPVEMQGSIYNTLLTPKHCMLNNGAWIHSVLDLMDDKVIKFGTHDKNEKFETVLAGVNLIQKQDIQVGALPDKLFKPYYATFKTKVDENVLAVIDGNPFGKVKWSDGIDTFTAFLMDGGVEPHTDEEQEWKLLVAPEVDMKKFKVNF